MWGNLEDSLSSHIFFRDSSPKQKLGNWTFLNWANWEMMVLKPVAHFAQLRNDKLTSLCLCGETFTKLWEPKESTRLPHMITTGTTGQTGQQVWVPLIQERSSRPCAAQISIWKLQNSYYTQSPSPIKLLSSRGSITSRNNSTTVQ